MSDLANILCECTDKAHGKKMEFSVVSKYTINFVNNNLLQTLPLLFQVKIQAEFFYNEFIYEIY